jgi:hypothetical protein
MTASNIATPKIPTIEARPAPEKLSDQIERWLASDGDKTLGGLIDMFEEKSFALIFILLLGVPALPSRPAAPRTYSRSSRSSWRFSWSPDATRSGCPSAGARSKSGPVAVGHASSQG